MSSAQTYQTISRRPPDIEDYIDMLRRYRGWIIAPMFAGLVIAVVVAFLWPDTYVSRALLRVTPSAVPEQLIPAVSYSQMAERLQQMQTELLSRNTLEDIIRKPSLDLYKKKRERVPMEDIIQEMKNKYIKLTPVAVSNDRRYAAAFEVSFMYPDKYKAQLVVRELVTRLTETNIRVQTEGSKVTIDFLKSEVDKAKERMDALDKQLTGFRLNNQGRLPEQVSSNQQAILQLQMQAMAFNQAIDRSSAEKRMLESDLQNLRQEQNYNQSGLEILLPGGQAVRNEKLVKLNDRINQVKQELAALKSVYGPNYPQIAEATAALETLEKQQAELEREETAAVSADAGSNGPRRITNSSAEKALQNIRAQINTKQTQIATKDAEIQNAIKGRAEIQKQMAVYQKRIDEAPVTDQQYASMVAELNQAKQAWLDANKKWEQSQTAKNLEEHKAGENLDVLDAASLPDKPVEPNRWAWAGFGTLAGLVCGLGLAAAREVKNTSLKNLKDVRAYTNLPVLSSVPLLENALLLRRKRRLVWLAWSSAVIVGCVLMLGSMYYYFSSTV
jgi:polysaccharide biosynthesis transport protein